MLHEFEEGVKVQVLAIKLPLDILEANLEVRLKTLRQLAKARNAGNSLDLLGGYQVLLFSSSYHDLKEHEHLVPHIVVLIDLALAG